MATVTTRPMALEEIIEAKAETDGQFAIAYALLQVAEAQGLVANRLRDIAVFLDAIAAAIRSHD